MRHTGGNDGQRVGHAGLSRSWSTGHGGGVTGREGGAETGANRGLGRSRAEFADSGRAAFLRLGSKVLVAALAALVGPLRVPGVAAHTDLLFQRALHCGLVFGHTRRFRTRKYNPCETSDGRQRAASARLRRDAVPAILLRRRIRASRRTKTTTPRSPRFQPPVRPIRARLRCLRGR